MPFTCGRNQLPLKCLPHFYLLTYIVKPFTIFTDNTTAIPSQCQQAFCTVTIFKTSISYKKFYCYQLMFTYSKTTNTLVSSDHNSFKHFKYSGQPEIKVTVQPKMMLVRVRWCRLASTNADSLDRLRTDVFKEQAKTFKYLVFFFFICCCIVTYLQLYCFLLKEPLQSAWVQWWMMQLEGPQEHQERNKVDTWQSEDAGRSLPSSLLHILWRQMEMFF